MRQNYEDMMEILEHYQMYVPSVRCEKYILDTGITEDKQFLTTLLGASRFLVVILH